MAMLGKQWTEPSIAVKTLSKLDVNSIYGLRNLECPTLGELSYIKFKDNTGEEYNCSVYLLIKVITSYLKAVNSSLSMTPDQVKVMARDMVYMYPGDPIIMFKLFFREARCGKFGSDYGKLDEPTIMNWYAKYKKEVLQYVSKLRKETKKNVDNEDDVAEIPKWFLDKIKDGCRKNNNTPKSKITIADNPYKSHYLDMISKEDDPEKRARIVSEYLNMIDNEKEKA